MHNLTHGLNEERPMLPPDYIDRLKKEYPRRDGDNGWIHVRTLIPRALHAGATWERILTGTRAYRAHCDKKGLTGTDLVKQAKTFFGPNMYFDEWADMQPIKTPQQIALERRWEVVKARAADIGFRPPHAHESPDIYETQIKLAERDKRTESSGVISMLAKQKAIA